MTSPGIGLTAIKPDPGTYVLVLRSDKNQTVQIGRWGLLDVHPGYYVYVGSAFGAGGVRARVARHCRKEKKSHWHVDYLREVVVPISVWYRCDAERLEHSWAEAIGNMDHIVPVRGFGCSDCACQAHLFFTRAKPRISKFMRALGGPVVSGFCDK